jgi:hypothetical protein
LGGIPGCQGNCDKEGRTGEEIRSGEEASGRGQGEDIGFHEDRCRSSHTGRGVSGAGEDYVVEPYPRSDGKIRAGVR